MSGDVLVGVRCDVQHCRNVLDAVFVQARCLCRSGGYVGDGHVAAFECDQERFASSKERGGGSVRRL